MRSTSAHIDVHKMIADGNTIVVKYTFTRTRTGPMLTATGEKIPPSNRTLSGPALDTPSSTTKDI